MNNNGDPVVVVVVRYDSTHYSIDVRMMTPHDSKTVAMGQPVTVAVVHWLSQRL